MYSRVFNAIGTLAIAIGIALAGFVGYEYWWTNNTAAEIQEIQRDEVLHQWSTNTTSPFGDLGLIPLQIGETFALMYIPRLRNEVWGMPVIEGTEDEHLARGIGHYPLTAQPGQVGNFVTFGHRTTHGQPYSNIDLLRDGDQVFVQTESNWFVYTLKVDAIVEPTDVWVMRSRPLEHARVPQMKNKHLITLITCTPRHSIAERWVWWGDLTEVRAADDSPL